MAIPFEDLPKTILEWEKNFKQTSLAARKKSGSTFLDSVVDGTPQDTGETVSNWVVGRGDVPPTGLLPPYFKGRKGNTRNANRVATKSKGKGTIRQLKRAEGLFIVNNSPVMALLEAGLSAQAPRGNIVATAVARALREYRDIKSWMDGSSNDIDSDI